MPILRFVPMLLAGLGLMAMVGLAAREARPEFFGIGLALALNLLAGWAALSGWNRGQRLVVAVVGLAGCFLALDWPLQGILNLYRGDSKFLERLVTLQFILTFFFAAIVPWALVRGWGWYADWPAQSIDGVRIQPDLGRMAKSTLAIALVLASGLGLALLLIQAAGIKEDWATPAMSRMPSFVIAASVISGLVSVPLLWAALSNWRWPAWVIYGAVLPLASGTFAFLFHNERSFHRSRGQLGVLAFAAVIFFSLRAVGFRFVPESLATLASVTNQNHDAPRRRVQFTLRSSLLLILLIAVPLAWLTSMLRQSQQSVQMLARWRDLGAVVRMDEVDVVGLAGLDGRTLSAFNLAELAKMQQLQSLEASYLGADGLAQVERLAELQSLTLHYTILSKEHLQSWQCKNNLVRLNLANCQLNDAELDALANYPSLRTLTLANTPLTGAAVNSLVRVPELGELDVRGTSLQLADVARLIAEQPALRALWFPGGELNNNELILQGGFSAEALAPMTHLERIRSLKGPFDDDALRGIALAPKLDSLILQGNQATPHGLAQLIDAPRLTYLDLNQAGISAVEALDFSLARPNTQILISTPAGSLQGGSLSLKHQVTEGIWQAVSTLPRLSGVTIDVAPKKNRFRIASDRAQPPASASEAAELTRMTQLEVLKIASPLAQEQLGQLATLPHLNSLTLNNARLTTELLTLLASCEQLGTLTLAFYTPTPEGLAELAGLPALQRLVLESRTLTDKDLPALKRLTRLQELHLPTARITSPGLAELRAALPQCQIAVGQGG